MRLISFKKTKLCTAPAATSKVGKAFVGTKKTSLLFIILCPVGFLFVNTMILTES